MQEKSVPKPHIKFSLKLYIFITKNMGIEVIKMKGINKNVNRKYCYFLFLTL